MEIDSLFQEAFLIADPMRATEAIGEARQRVATEGKTGGFSLEVVVPADADERWLEARVLRPLVYLGESIGAPAPDCPGIFLSFFARDRLFCVLGAEVIAWAAARQKRSPAELAQAYSVGASEPAPAP